MKKLLLINRADRPHWVGDGFPVRSMFSYQNLGRELSPFLLMDYAGPTNFSPSDHQRGVGEHPHRGFETVTIVYDGEVEHRDSSGGGGIIRAGDVQWMTAAAGLVHEEFHGREFSKIGGPFEMIQLWVNLPKKDKMSKPHYQGIQKKDIAVVKLPEQAGEVRVIAGDFQGTAGAAKTFSPINLWDVKLNKGAKLDLNLPDGHTTAVFVLSGQVMTGDEKLIVDSEIGIFEQEGSRLTLTAKEDSKILFLGGEPIHEPIVGYGPFVMNTQAEIHQAMMDFQQGKMGVLR
jgi:redox-sensitive bicupin YhaK (pirin superfamily)